VSSSSQQRSTLRRVLTCAATACLLSSVRVNGQPATLSVVIDAACPLVLQEVRVERTPTGIVARYTLRNDQAQHVKQIVLTAATVDWLGAVVAVRMLPLNQASPSTLTLNTGQPSKG
jgi:hypothetical protein